MKITFLINELSIRGGTHKQLLRLCQYSERQGLDFTIITKSYLPDLGYNEFKNYSNRIKVFDPKNRSTLNNIKTQFKIADYIKKNKSDIVNIHDNGFQYAIIFSRLLGVRSKIFWQINDLPGCFRVGNLKTSRRKLIHAYSSSIIKFAARLVDQVTVNVSKNKERVAEKLKKNALVLYCGIDEELINLEILKKKINLPKIKLLSIGIFFPYRNYETLVETVKILADKNYQVELNIVGSTALNPEYVAKIETLIQNKNLIENIKILGNITEDQLKDLFATSDIFLFLNIDQSWGLAVFEAMANSLPVIVSNSVGATELLENNETAMIRDPKNAVEIAKSIEDLVRNPELLDNLVAQGKSAISDMSWDKMYCSKLIELFRNEK